MSKMKVHFIAIGGAVMHNLAISLQKKGYIITGSDDEIYEPSRSKLASYGLLPGKDGWDISRISDDLDVIILGMHAKSDNPELTRAKELGIRIMSFPEYIYDQTKNKLRIVVTGSHGKTTTTAIIMHVLKLSGRKFDYMAGSSIEGYETMVSLSDDSDLAVLEGDEYLTSPIDRRPKFHLYKPDIAVINGIAWDHMNVFPTYENYFEQFKILVETVSRGGSVIYFDSDPEVKRLVEFCREDIRKIPYKTHGYFRNKAGFFAASHNRVVEMKIFGEHNMQNLAAAREACYAAGITEQEFYSAIPSFEGTAKRLQKIFENDTGIVYLDFAHAPSKVKATVEAVVERYPDKQVIACLELHTFSSLNKDFLPQYRGTLDRASSAFVYFNPHALTIKKLPPISAEMVKEAFGDSRIQVFSNSDMLFSKMKELRYKNPVFLLMSSGDFDGVNLNSLYGELVSNK
jgi:UDP-N-acetylmuramate: L-alanyl-gamma-D-glutamyl-meso-diaminopimelate ligase